ncbi:MAG: hypothetical protein V8T31_06085 [Lachnospiraceae bacterium]
MLKQQAASGTAFSFDTTLVNNKGTEQFFSLSAEAPEGMAVTFTPSGESNAIASLNVDAGASQGITVAITPPETLTQGDYTIPISAISFRKAVNRTENDHYRILCSGSIHTKW